jgi:hypothetical protein
MVRVESYWEFYFLLEINKNVGPIVMKLHRNDPWDMQMCKKCLLNYEYQVGNGFSPVEFVLGDFVVGRLH